MDPASEVFSILERGLDEVLDVGPDAVGRCARLCAFLESWAKNLNLTGHRGAEGIARHLVLDAAAMLPHLGEFETLTDLGSGAGFPGLPFAILAPDRRFILVESRQRRHHFQRAAIRELGLDNVEPRHGRAESLDPEPSDIVIAQAMAAPGAALDFMVGWGKAGGRIVIPGNARPPEPGPHPEVEAPEIREYRVPLGGPARTLWIARKRAASGAERR